jgi:putative ABC transport system ATP-binding protein
MAIIVEAISLTKDFTNSGVVTQVLKGIDVQIEKGEFVAIMGRSGAGKSTLLYQLSLLDIPTSGEVVVDGVVTKGLTEVELTQFRLEKLGYVFQDYALVPELTAIENVAVPLYMQGKSKSEAYERATQALTRVEMADRLHFLPSQLSGGQQQRVSVARAIAHEPKILFADEPTANLDSDMAKNVLDILCKLNEAGQTIIMVTHELEYGEVADRVITLYDGKIVSYR